MHRSLRWSFFLLLVLLPRGLAAQDADILTGRVVDAEGAPVAGARVEAISIETEISRSVLTGSNGRYMMIFPDGGGRYLVRVTFIGMEPIVRTVIRESGEELLVTDFTMAPQAIQLQGLTVTAQAPPPGRGEAGEQSTDLTQEQLNRLPLPDLDPNTIALLAAGVVATSLDSLSGQLGFSVAGMSDLLNQITLDGMILGEGGLGVPEEGVRRTQVVTSSFDVSRGGFAGGQVSMTTARGNNRSSGSLSYRLDDDALQMNSSAITNAFTRHNLGGSWGGPIIRNKLFYNASFQYSRNTNHRFALAANDPLAALRSGVSVDSISRFLSILDTNYGFPTHGQTGRYNQFNSDIRLQGRLDWSLMQTRAQSHTISARFNLNVNSQDSTRINTMDLAHHGGETERNSRMGSLTVTSRFGGNWTNNLRASFNQNWNDALPYIELPEGVVRVTSDFEDGTRGTRSIVFGGNRSMPTEARGQSLQISDDLSFLLPIGAHIHRLKVGGTLQRSRDTRRSTDNLLGTYIYPSLEAFELNQPERYERALTEREVSTGRMSTGLYIGDTWRISRPLEVTFGLRWDYSRLDERPEYNPEVEAVFGRRTDIKTSASGFSPRIGFDYRLNQQGQPPRSLNGGIGLFSGQAPTNIYSVAIRETGLPNADRRLICIGEAVPIPDWEFYQQNPYAVPEVCADGGPGMPPALSLRAPNVTLINPDQSLPSSLRFDLGYRTRLPLNLNGDFRYGYSRGLGLWSYQDINLDESNTFDLAGEDRPFYGDPSAIVTGTGAVSLATSRKHDEFGHVYDVTSALRSATHQFTARLSGMLSQRIMANINYTLGYSRDESTGIRGGNTAGNPNESEWGVSGNDRRHTLSLMASYAFTPEIELSLMSRISSGAPFTPLVNRDINGDGLRNDRAFIFDPSTASDPELVAAMNRLLDQVPGRIRSCLESQFGQIAGRNSCRNGWTQSLDFRASLRPNLPTLQRRLTLSIDGRNALTGLDQLINGRNGMKGWGEGQRADATLLEVRGFDPVTRGFIYEINEGFGQTRRGPNAFRSPFSITISGRLAVGGQAFMNNRGFGGFGGRGMAGAGMIAAAMGGFGGAGGNFNAAEIVDRMLANPITVILEMKDTLKLSPEQVTQVEAISGRLQDQLNKRRESLGSRFDNLPPQQMAAVFQQAQPEIEATRKEVTDALAEAQKALNSTQWNQVPEQVRNPFRSMMGGAGGGGRAGGNFNAVGVIDRMLANPIPLILEMKETLKLSPEQVTQVEAISGKLQDQLNKRRESLGSRFDNLPPQQAAAVFQQVQPEIEATRKEVTDALAEVQKILNSSQWNQIPERIREPFRTNNMGPGQQRRSGRGGGL